MRRVLKKLWLQRVLCALPGLILDEARPTGCQRPERIQYNCCSQMSSEEQLEVGDHYKFTRAESSYWDSFESIGVAGPAGSLFLWDSRTVHAVWLQGIFLQIRAFQHFRGMCKLVHLGLQNVFPRRITDFRHAVYTCYQPASMASGADIQEKQRAYQEHLLTTHWPAMNIRLYERDQAVGATLAFALVYDADSC